MIYQYYCTYKVEYASVVHFEIVLVLRSRNLGKIKQREKYIFLYFVASN